MWFEMIVKENATKPIKNENSRGDVYASKTYFISKWADLTSACFSFRNSRYGRIIAPTSLFEKSFTESRVAILDRRLDFRDQQLT